MSTPQDPLTSRTKHCELTMLHVEHQHNRDSSKQRAKQQSTRMTPASVRTNLFIIAPIQTIRKATHTCLVSHTHTHSPPQYSQLSQ